MDGPEKRQHPDLYFKPTRNRKGETVGKKQQSKWWDFRRIFAEYPEHSWRNPPNSQSSPNTYYHIEKKM